MRESIKGETEFSPGRGVARVRQTSNRQLIRLPHNINDPEFCDEIVKAFRSLHGGNRPGRQQVRR